MKYFVQAIKKSSHYKKKNLEFDYLKKKDFDKIKENNEDIKVIGYIELKETNKKNTDVVVVETNDAEFQFEFNALKENEELKTVMGYVLVFDNTYVAIKKNLLIPIIILFGILIGGIIIGSMLIPSNNVVQPDIPNLEFEDGDDWDGNLPQNGEQSQASAESIEIPGYADLYVSTEAPEVQLINPKDNTVFFVYTLYENDEIIYQSKALEPNKMISLNLKELLPVGEHKIKLQIATYDVATQAPCNGATQEVSVTVRE